MPSKLDPIKSFFTENWLIKLLALALATPAVYAIQRITNQLDEFEIPIVVQVEKGIAVLRQDARTAYITCRGSFDDLKRLDTAQLRMVVSPKVSGIAGTEQVPIGPKNVNGPLRGVSIIKVRPGILNLTFDREIEKKISVAKPELAGKPLLGRAEVDYDPKIVSVRGPKQQLVDLKIVRTGPIDVDGVVDSFTQRLRVISAAESGVWDVNPAEITARVSIVTEAISKEWKAVPVLALREIGSGLDLTFSPARVDFSVLGSPQTVNRIDFNDIRIFVDCTQITQPGIYSIPAAAHLNGNAEISTAVTPPLIAVTVKRRLPSVDPTVKPEETTNVIVNTVVPLPSGGEVEEP